MFLNNQIEGVAFPLLRLTPYDLRVYRFVLFYYKSMLNNLHTIAVYSDDIKPYLFIKAFVVF